MKDFLPAYISRTYIAMAESRYMRQHGTPMACHATHDDIVRMERACGNGEINWAKEDQLAIVEAIVTELVLKM